MKFLLPLILCCVAAAPSTTTAPAETAPATYRQAFVLLDSLNEADRGRLGLCGKDGCWVVTTPLDESTSKLLGNQQKSIALARRAATMPYAKWVEDGDAKEMVEIANHAPRLSALMVLQARHEMRDNKPAEAIDDLFCAFALSRHVAAEQTILSRLIEFASWRPAAEVLAEKLPTLPKELLATLPKRFEDLPASTTDAEVVTGEYDFARATTAKQGFMAMTMLAGLKGFYATVKENASLPPAEFNSLVDKELKTSSSPFAPSVGSSFKSLRATSAILQAKQAMLLAAIDVVLRGEGAVSASKDPFADDKPFAYRKTSRGFELKSAIVVRDKPVVLLVGSE